MSVPVTSAPAVIAPPAAAAPQHWWVLHTRPRMEKAVARALAVRDLALFLPLVQVRHRYARSHAVFEKPLFPGYVFLCGDAAARELALQTNRLVQVLPVADQRTFCAELEQIRRALAADQPLELFPALRPGTRCRVAHGPLRGLEGVVVHLGPRAQLQLAVTLLGQSAVLEIDASLLEAL